MNENENGATAPMFGGLLPATAPRAETASDSAAETASDSAAETASDSAEIVGMALLESHGAVLQKVCALAVAAADKPKNKAYGMVEAEAMSYAVQILAIRVGAEGMPVSDDERAYWVSCAANAGAEKARDWARRGQRDRGAEKADRAVRDAPPNSLGRWTNDALVRRAERYTVGAIGAREARGAALPARWQVSSDGAVSPIGTGIGTGLDIGDGAAIGTGRVASDPTTLTARVQAGAVLAARDESGMRPWRSFGKATARHAGGTSPSAESVYWRQRGAMVTDASLETALALAGVPMRHLTGLSVWYDEMPNDEKLRDVWHKSGTLNWENLARRVGAPRGTVRDKVRGAAGAARLTARCRHTGAGSACQCVASPEVGGAVLAPVAAPAVETALLATAPPMPSATGLAAIGLPSPFASLAPRFVGRGDDSGGGATMTAPAPVNDLVTVAGSATFGGATYIVASDGAVSSRADVTSAHVDAWIADKRRQRGASGAPAGAPTGLVALHGAAYGLEAPAAPATAPAWRTAPRGPIGAGRP